MMMIPKQYCDHEYECVHFDGRYRCMHCGDVCYHGVNGSDPSSLRIEDMVRDLLGAAPAHGENWGMREGGEG